MKISLSAKEIKAFIGLLLVMILVGIVNGVPFVFGDAYGYFHVGKTLTTQGIYPSTFEPEYYEYTGHAVNLSNGKYVTAYSVGQSILYFPFQFVASFFNQGSTNTDYYKAFNGHSIADGLAILTASMLFAYLGLIFCYLFLREIGFSKKISFFSTLSIYIGLYVLSYTFEQPGYSHVYEFFAYSAFLYYFVKFFFSKHPKFLYAASIFAGLLVLIRIVDVSLVLIPFLFVLYKMRSKKLLITTSVIIAFFAAILLYYNFISYGSPFVLGYTNNGQNGFTFSLNIINLLFSDTRGLFIWSPIAVLSMLGLIMYSRKSKVALIFFLIPTLLLMAIYNFWGNWWGGVSTGQRFFIVLAPLLALGLAYFYSEFKFKFIARILIFALVLFSFITAIVYRLTPVLKINSAFRTDSAALTTPISEDYRLSDMYRYHARLFTHRSGTTDYLNKIRDGFNGGRSLLLLILGQTDPLVKVESTGKLKYRVYFVPANTHKDINANLMVTITYKDLSRSYLISNKNFKEASSAVITCDTALNCSGDSGLELIAAFADRKKQTPVKVAEGEKFSVYGENIRINYVNLKLK